jgi:hypothetical protein
MAGSASMAPTRSWRRSRPIGRIEHLERSGYVVMCKPGLDPHGAAGNLAGAIEKAAKVDRTE